MKKVSGIFLVALTSTALFLGALLNSNAYGSAAMPKFTLKQAVDGKEVNSSEFEGKVLLVSFFATWCAPCVQEIPTFNELQKKYSKEGFSIVALSVDEGGAEVVADVIKKRKIKYPVLMADTKTMNNFGGVYGIPVSFLVNRDGNVVKKYPGYVPGSILTKDISSILN